MAPVSPSVKAWSSAKTYRCCRRSRSAARQKAKLAAAGIGRGVLLSAGATVLGNVDIGDFAKIGAGSLVLASVPSGYTAVGVPARLVGRASARPALNMDQSLP